MAKFRDLTIDQSFDFVDPENFTQVSFWKRCVKTSGRTYTCIETGVRYTVGSIDCKVFNLGVPVPGGRRN